jgi:hypothetical protein
VLDYPNLLTRIEELRRKLAQVVSHNEQPIGVEAIRLSQELDRLIVVYYLWVTQREQEGPCPDPPSSPNGHCGTTI